MATSFLKGIRIFRDKIFPAPSIRKSWSQILLALSITFSIVFALAWLENEQVENQQVENQQVKNQQEKCKYNFSIATIICLTSDLKLLAQAQNIAVISAAILFFLDTFDRKKQLERQAWQLIDGAQGSETSGARRQAIEELYQEGSDITGLDADGADLREINLSGANLTGASFKNAILERANFEGANLEEANFTGANLKGANFKKAKLWGTDFTRADLRSFEDRKTDSRARKTDLRDADLGLTIFNRAKLSGAIFGVIDSEPHLGKETNLMGAKLRGVNLKDVNLNKTCIAKAKLGGATIEDIETIRNADKYQEASYSQDFFDAHKDELKHIDSGYDTDPEFQQITTQKIIEISQRLLSKESLSLQDEESLSDFVNLLNHLVILVKESNNQCLTENELFDKVIDLKKDLEEQKITVSDASEKSKYNEELIQETKERLAKTKESRNKK
ncbi:MAG: pentapeptide repeat-containing protein [Microcoleus sp. CSU_2_2]|nr:pentapeptide repeat-containing protein [Microcoleus sp. CSU_2_2]